MRKEDDHNAQSESFDEEPAQEESSQEQNEAPKDRMEDLDLMGSPFW